jgi:Ras-related protein Rab-11B
MPDSLDYIWKVVVCGAGGVGKTTLLYRYIHRTFVDNLKLTVGVQFHTQQLIRQGMRLNLVLWDLGGQERFRFVQGDYVKGAAAAFILFDLSDPSTLENARDEWIPMIRQFTSPSIPIVLVGTKMDKVGENDLRLTSALAEHIAKKHSLCGFSATSSKWNVNIDETILYMVDVLIWQAFQAEHGCSTAEYIL